MSKDGARERADDDEPGQHRNERVQIAREAADQRKENVKHLFHREGPEHVP